MKCRESLLLLLMIMTLVLSACSEKTIESEVQTPLVKSTGEAYLYGEIHGVEVILNREVELWSEYYSNQGMRHMFVELPYYTAEFLNEWMQSDNDVILDELYNDWVDTAIHKPVVKAFFMEIKNKYPETIFHGTDVGHQHRTTGQRYIGFLKENGLEGSEQYVLTLENIDQGVYYYKNADSIYRENKMADNFVREFDLLKGERIMGIYGSAHISAEYTDVTKTTSTMAEQLKERYDDLIITEDLSHLNNAIDPTRVDRIEISGKEYEASFYGVQDLRGFKNFESRAFWRLEDAYGDFKNHPKTNDVLTYSNYPMPIETGQVFVINYTYTDGSTERTYYRSDGNEWNGMLSTEEFTVD